MHATELVVWRMVGLAVCDMIERTGKTEGALEGPEIAAFVGIMVGCIAEEHRTEVAQAILGGLGRNLIRKAVVGIANSEDLMSRLVARDASIRDLILAKAKAMGGQDAKAN
jgi:hypothetical protein